MIHFSKHKEHKGKYLYNFFVSFMSSQTAITVCLTGLILFYIYHCFFWFNVAIDDAYITFRYARNFQNGLGFVYNLGERVEGYSNFSWLLLISLGIKLGFEPIVTAKLLGLFSGVGSILCSYLLYNRLSSRSFTSLLPPLLLAVNSFFCYWSFSGLETVFFSFILIFSVVLYTKEDQKSYPWSAFVLGLLCLSRPEGLGYLVVFLVFDVFLRIRHKRLIDRNCLWFYGIIFSILVCYTIFKLAYFGSLFPNTYYAKTGLPFQNYDITSVYLLDFYSLSGLVFIVLTAFTACFFFLKSKTCLAISLLLFNWFYILYVYFDWMPNYRHHIYTAPILFTIVALGLSKLIWQLNKRNKFYGLAVRIIITLVIMRHVDIILNTKSVSAFRSHYIGKNKNSNIKKPVGWLWKIPEKIKHGIRPDKKQINYTMFLIENTNSEMTVGVRDIGFPGYITNCRIYDRDMLIHKKAETLSDVLKGQDDKAISDYIFVTMREHLESYDPDFFLYPEVKFINPEFLRWDLFNQMYSDYFNDKMELVKKKKFGIVTHAYYRKKGLTWRPSTRELIRKYEKIVRENQTCLAFKKRLKKLYQVLEKE